MNDTGQYRGVAYTLPHNDSGEWRVIVHSKALKMFPEFKMIPRPAYVNREAAIVEARRTIDAIVGSSGAGFAPGSPVPRAPFGTKRVLMLSRGTRRANTRGAFA